MEMTLEKFLAQLKLQKPLIAIRGDIFDTLADHIAFAVHWPNKKGHANNNAGGFSSKVAEFGWTDLGDIVFKKGEVRSRKIKGKTFHAMAVHTPEEGGWDETPQLIENCLNILPVSSIEVVAVVLIGGGDAGAKYNATVRNLEGMVKTCKTVVLYVYDDPLYELLVATGVTAQPLPQGVSLTALPKVVKYRDQQLGDLRKVYELQPIVN